MNSIDLWFTPKVIIEVEISQYCYDCINALGGEGLFIPKINSFINPVVVIDLELLRDISCDISITDLYAVLVNEAPLRCIDLDSTGFLFLKVTDDK